MVIPGLGMVPAFAGRAYVKESTQSLPYMTTDNAPSGYTAFASSYYQNNPIYAAYKAFNNTQSDFWHSNAAGGIIGRSTPSPIRVWRYRIYPRQGQYSQIPASWLFQGSPDGSSYTTLDSRSGVTWSSDVFQDFDVSEGSRGEYSYHRLNCTHGAFVALGEIELLQEA